MLGKLSLKGEISLKRIANQLITYRVYHFPLGMVLAHHFD